jgi:hypothetical protein
LKNVTNWPQLTFGTLGEPGLRRPAFMPLIASAGPAATNETLPPGHDAVLKPSVETLPAMQRCLLHRGEPR